MRTKVKKKLQKKRIKELKRQNEQLQKEKEALKLEASSNACINFARSLKQFINLNGGIESPRIHINRSVDPVEIYSDDSKTAIGVFSKRTITEIKITIGSLSSLFLNNEAINTLKDLFGSEPINHQDLFNEEDDKLCQQ